jgi:hypothetical protein
MRRWLLVILLISLCINTVGIGWGLPNGDRTWAADALTPTAPMAIAKHVFGGDPSKSGWFYFKYPLGHPLVLLAAQLPYLAWLKVTHRFQSPQGTYPFGFRDPERALSVLALIMRGVSVLMGVGVVALAYATTAILFGRLAGLATAVLVAGCYPMVFYAHTANVDTPMLFWIALAVTAALLSADSGSGAAAVVVGIASAMALFTKEQSIGALASIPLVWLLWRRSRGAVEWGRAARQAAWAATGFFAAVSILGNVWWNPAGFLNRWRFLLGTLPVEVREKYAPYQYHFRAPGGLSLTTEIDRVRKVVHALDALTAPVVLLCVVGAAWALWRRPRQAVIPLVMVATYYALSLRATPLIPLRYVMPLLYFLLLLAGAACGAALEGIRRWSDTRVRRVASTAAVAAMACALLPGLEIDRLLVHDPRYAAEAWMRTHAAGARVEIYQPPTYLPRFSPEMQVAQVPVPERTIGLFQQREPEFVVLSSGGAAGLTGRYDRNWQPGKPILTEASSAKEFLERLRTGQLGYQVVARFSTPPRWISPRINSLSPEITIFAPNDSGARNGTNR